MGCGVTKASDGASLRPKAVVRNGVLVSGASGRRASGGLPAYPLPAVRGSRLTAAGQLGSANDRLCRKLPLSNGPTSGSFTLETCR